jgi:hypothetical protein
LLDFLLTHNIFVMIGWRGYAKNEILRQQRWFQFSHWELSICISNIPSAPTYGVYISQLIRYSRACDSYDDFLDRGLLLTGIYWIKGLFWICWPNKPLTFCITLHALCIYKIIYFFSVDNPPAQRQCTYTPFNNYFDESIHHQSMFFTFF